MWKKVLKVLGACLLAALVIGALYVFMVVRAFNASMSKVYDVPAPNVTRSTDPAVIARGKHLAESLGSCTSADCHGADLAGGKTLDLGPLGKLTGPNITPAGAKARYSDAEMARLIVYGIRRDGRSVAFMPSTELGWWPDEDLGALASYLATVPPVERPDGPVEIGLLAKVLDRHDVMPIDQARRIAHKERPKVPPPAPTAAYGAFLSLSCIGCHGETLSGGRIPGAPPELAVPSNLTPHETGLAKWSFEDFDRLMTQGIKPDGKKLSTDMPFDSFSKMNETEKQALWAYLRIIPARPFGNR